jgi:hypothetical protein
MTVSNQIIQDFRTNRKAGKGPQVSALRAIQINGQGESVNFTQILEVIEAGEAYAEANARPLDELTFLEELEQVGSICRGQCVLVARDGFYVMSAGFGQTHRVAISVTDESRLIAHWAGFVENQCNG